MAGTATAGSRETIGIAIVKGLLCLGCHHRLSRQCIDRQREIVNLHLGWLDIAISILFVFAACRIIADLYGLTEGLQFKNRELRNTLLHQQFNGAVGHGRHDQGGLPQANSQLIHRTLLALLTLKSFRRQSRILEQHFIFCRIKTAL